MPTRSYYVYVVLQSIFISCGVGGFYLTAERNEFPIPHLNLRHKEEIKIGERRTCMFGSVYNAKCTYTAHTNAVHDKLELFVATIRKENRFFNSFRRGSGVPCTVSMFHTLTSRIGNGNNFLRCRSIDITKLKQTRQTNLLSFGLVRFEMCRLTLCVSVCSIISLAPASTFDIRPNQTLTHTQPYCCWAFQFVAKNYFMFPRRENYFLLLFVCEFADVVWTDFGGGKHHDFEIELNWKFPTSHDIATVLFKVEGNLPSIHLKRNLNTEKTPQFLIFLWEKRCVIYWSLKWIVSLNHRYTATAVFFSSSVWLPRSFPQECIDSIRLRWEEIHLNQSSIDLSPRFDWTDWLSFLLHNVMTNSKWHSNHTLSIYGLR